jgi:hypothetical protein
MPFVAVGEVSLICTTGSHVAPHAAEDTQLPCLSNGSMEAVPGGVGKEGRRCNGGGGGGWGGEKGERERMKRTGLGLRDGVCGF